MSQLVVRGLGFRYPGAKVDIFQDIAFTLEPGHVLAVRGVSGCGKTTLLHLLCGVIPQIFPGERSGSILLDNEDVADVPLNRLGGRINLLMQDPSLQMFFPEVEQELAFALENHCLPAAEIRSRVENALSEFGITHLRHASTARLSCGEGKLVALAALFCLHPDILLLDEPAAGLAPATWEIVEGVLHRWIEAGGSLIIADHDPRAQSFTDSVLNLGRQ